VRAEDIALAHRLADAAASAIRPYFRAGFATDRKADASPVTDADRAAEAAMRAILDAEVPRDAIVGEEYGEKPGSTGRTWVLDPIDGTTSFIAGRPIFGTLVALIVDQWPVLGLIDQPIARERWIGAAGHGTHFNGRPVHARLCPDIGDAILATTSPHLFTDHDAMHFMALAKSCDTRRLIWGGDCYNYALLAGGHVDLVCEAGLKPHDFAALVPVVENAGGHMCDWHGDPLHAGSDGRVVAMGDPARLEDVLAALSHAEG